MGNNQKQNAMRAIERSKGLIFQVVFIKKNGQVRRMRCRLGVKKGVKGKGLAFNPRKKGLLCVYDVDKREFRMINLRTLLEVSVNGKKYVTW